MRRRVPVCLLLVLIGGAHTAQAEDAAVPRSFENSIVSGFVGLDFGGRQLHYRDRVSNANLRPYDLPNGALLPVAPGLAASAELFPLTTTGWVVARDVGLSARTRYNFVSSKVGDISPKTRWFAWELDLRGRIPLGPIGSAPLLGIEAGLGRDAFLFTAPGAAQDILPSVDYYYFRLGADARIPVSVAQLLVGLSYRHLESRRGPNGATVPAAGALGEHFPNAKFAGVDLKLGGALPLTANLEARLVFNYVRYWADLRPAPDASYVAAGATEQMLNADVGLAAFF
jgi:hypothetical protein